MLAIGCPKRIEVGVRQFAAILIQDSRERFGTALDSVGQLPVYTPQGTMVPLSTLAEVKETVDTSTLRRINAKRTVTLNLIPPAAIALETGVEMVREKIVGYLYETGQVPAKLSSRGQWVVIA